MRYKGVSLFLIICMLFCLVACNNAETQSNLDSENDSTDVEQEDLDTDEENQYNYNERGDFQSSLLGMAIEDGWIYYRNYFDDSDGIKRAVLDAEYGQNNVETVFIPSEHKNEMAELIGWNNTGFYEPSDITSIDNLQVAGGWIYWASECVIWRLPNRYDACIYDLEAVAVIGVPERPTCTNFYVDGDWIYYACNAIKERYDSSTALVEHCLCKQNLETKERIVLNAATPTKERLGGLYGHEYYQLLDLKTVCDDGRIYFSDYTQKNIYYYKNGEVYVTEFRAYKEDPSSITDKRKETMLFASKNGHIVAMYGTYDADYYYFKDEKLAKGTKIEDFEFIANDGYYYTLSDGLYKSYFDGNSTKVTNDDVYGLIPGVHVVGICGDYLYYYTESEDLCRMGVDGGNWEDVSWMIY